MEEGPVFGGPVQKEASKRDVRGGPEWTSNSSDDAHTLKDQPKPGKAFCYNEEEWLRKEALMSRNIRSAGQRQIFEVNEANRRKNWEREQREQHIVVNRPKKGEEEMERREPERRWGGPIVLDEEIGRPEEAEEVRIPLKVKVRNEKVKMVPFERDSDEEGERERERSESRLPPPSSVSITVSCSEDDDEEEDENAWEDDESVMDEDERDPRRRQ